MFYGHGIRGVSISQNIIIIENILLSVMPVTGSTYWGAS
jgi:hypothetical protein